MSHQKPAHSNTRFLDYDKQLAHNIKGEGSEPVTLLDVDQDQEGNIVNRLKALSFADSPRSLLATTRKDYYYFEMIVVFESWSIELP